MKQGTFTIKLVMAILFGAVVLYIGYYAVNLLLFPLTTAPVYTDTADVSLPVSGYVVRDEAVIPASYSIVDIQREEGERVGRGKVIAEAFKSADALARSQKIRALEQRLDQLKAAAGVPADGGDASKTDAGILTRLISVKSAVAGGELSGTEDDIQELKNLVFRRDYAYSNAANMDQMTAELNSQLAALLQASTSDTTEVTAQESGIYSGLVDGYESVLTVDSLNDMTPSDFDRIAPDKQPADSALLGKLVLGNDWYFVTAVSKEDASSLRQKKTVTIRFSKDVDGEISMKVARVGEAENGRCVVVFSLDRYLSQMTLQRHLTADIIDRSYSGLRIPKKAVRMNEQGQAGVYCVVGLQAEFKRIAIVYEGGDYYLVKPAEKDDGTPLDGAMMLRENDEVIVSASGLYDGKVVR